MTPFVRLGFIVAVACAAGCASAPVAEPSAVATSARTTLIAPVRAKDAVMIGRSTRADVRAALGETLAISFDNGYEVWVYHLSDDPRAAQRRWLRPQAAASAEFVILFAPSGVVTKTRTRPAPRGSP